MSFSGQIAIAGVHEYESRWAPDKTELQIIAESARGALADAGLGIDDVDALFTAGMSGGGMYWIEGDSRYDVLNHQLHLKLLFLGTRARLLRSTQQF